MKLSHLTDDQLFIDTKNLVTKELKTTAEILWHLKEIDSRRLYSVYKCASLFDFCVKVLKYSEGSASRRVAAARLLKTNPEIMPKIESGKLNLTNLSMIARNTKNAPKLKIELFEKIQDMSCREAERIIIKEIGQTEIKPKVVTKQVSVTQQEVKLVLKNETVEKLDKIKALLSNKNKSTDEILEMALSALEEKLSRPVRKYEKEINIAKTRKDLLKTQSCVNCGSNFRLNIDHIKPKALGGASSAQNFRVLCFNCNQRKRIEAKL